MHIELSVRQLEIIDLVKAQAPITGEQIAETFGISRQTLRTDLSILVMLGYIDAKPKVGYFIGKALTPGSNLHQNIKELKVRDIQGVPVIVPDTIPVHDAVVTLFLENVGSLIVTDSSGELVGMVSRKDLLKVTLGNANASNLPISMVMTRQPNLIMCSPDEPVLEAARKMIYHQVDSLPVIEHGEIIGRVTKTSMTRVLLDLASEV